MKKHLLVIALSLAAGHAAACYTVYDINGRILYHEPEPPVDMSQPLHVGLDAKFSKSVHLIFNLAEKCRTIAPGEMARPTSEHVPENTVKWQGKLVSDPIHKLAY